MRFASEPVLLRQPRFTVRGVGQVEAVVSGERLRDWFCGRGAGALSPGEEKTGEQTTMDNLSEGYVIQVLAKLNRMLR